jgi:hypothetical protein
VQYLQILRKHNGIGMRYLILLLLLAGCEPNTGTVYGCHEKDLPKEVELECRHIRDFKRPYMKDGCVYQESHGQVIKTCG